MPIVTSSTFGSTGSGNFLEFRNYVRDGAVVPARVCLNRPGFALAILQAKALFSEAASELRAYLKIFAKVFLGTACEMFFSPFLFSAKVSSTANAGALWSESNNSPLASLCPAGNSFSDKTSFIFCQNAFLAPLALFSLHSRL